SVPDPGSLTAYLGPSLIASMGLMWWLARECFFPIVTDASSLFLALRVAPTGLLSLVKPFGTPFAVTPKGASAKGQRGHCFIFCPCLGLVVATLAGLAANGLDDWRVVQDRPTLAFAALWAVVNCVILGITAMIAREGPRYRAQERFSIEAPARCISGT